METKIIAEIGINHNGQIDTARKLIESAVGAKCWGIKFQYRNIYRSHIFGANELGDEILSSEINRNYLKPSDILDLKDFGRSLGIKVGISFFILDDVWDFNELDFDFFKVPSAEMLNFELINFLISTDKYVLISTGMHDDNDLDILYAQISDIQNWTPLYCVSNYPTRAHNVRLAAINGIREICNRNCGYSSHDDNLGVIFAALNMGLPYFERHITLDKNVSGLDHSSSSTPDEFSFFSEFLHQVKFQNIAEEKTVNQGEIINRQNLGRSWYATKNLVPGMEIKRSDFVYRSPQKGLDWYSAHAAFAEGSLLKEELAQDEPLTDMHLNRSVRLKLSDDDLQFCEKHQIGIPVRPHDIFSLSHVIPCNNYEFHLSFKDMDQLEAINVNSLPSDALYSIHAPDYISPTELLDPFSTDKLQAVQSSLVFSNLIEFAEKLSEHSSSEVPIVASLSNPSDIPSFYDVVLEFYRTLGYRLVTFQWLPPFAWYFGGSVEMNVFSSIKHVEDIQNANLPITLDTSHVLMGQNYFNFCAHELVDELMGNIRHIHLSDAVGFDGEGIQIQPDSVNVAFFEKVLQFECRKILEIWRGHLGGGTEFIRAIKNLRIILGREGD